MTPPNRAAYVRTPVLLLGLALALPLADATAQDAGRALPLASYLDMESVSDAQISPDGRQIIYTRGWIDKVNDRRRSSV